MLSNLKAFQLSKSFCVTTAVLCSVNALGQGLVNKLESSLSSDSKLESEKNSSFKNEVGFKYNELVQDVGDIVGNQYFGHLNLDYKSKTSDGTFKSFEFNSRINNEEILEYSIKEAYIEFSDSDGSRDRKVGFGRTNLKWSRLDSSWGLGKVNNRINFDYFEPGEEGLIGGFYNLHYKTGFQVDMFGSVLYVPEMSQGMSINKEDGSITCKTAWCDAPEATAEIEGKEVPIYYDVNYPDVSDVIYRYSLGLSLGYDGDENSVRLFHLKKPENNFTVSAEISAPADLSQINVEVTPEFYYHDVTGFEYEGRLGDSWTTTVSALNISPSKYPDGDQQYIEYTGIKPKKKLEQYVGIETEYKNEVFTSQLGYIARVSDFDTESDMLVDYPRWNNAIHLYLDYMWTRTIHTELDIKFDTFTEDRLTMFKLDYLFSAKFIASLGVNMIGTDRSEESYWSKYDNNDAVYTSLKYRF